MKALLGLGQRAGKVVSGDQACRAACERRELALIILSEDAGPSTRKRFVQLGELHGVDALVWGRKEWIGEALGKPPRAVAGVRDRALADAILAAAMEEKGYEVMLHGKDARVRTRQGPGREQRETR